MGAPTQRDTGSQLLSQTQAVSLLLDYIAVSSDRIASDQNAAAGGTSGKNSQSGSYQISYGNRNHLQRTHDQPQLPFPFQIYILTWL